MGTRCQDCCAVAGKCETCEGVVKNVKVYTVKDALEIMDQIMASQQATIDAAAAATASAKALTESTRFAFRRFKSLHKFE